MKTLLANRFLSVFSDVWTLPSGKTHPQLVELRQSILGTPRTVDKLDRIVTEVDGLYDQMAELQAEGDTTGYNEKLLN